MLILTAEDIRSVMTMEDAIRSDKEAFIAQSEGNVELPVRISFAVPGKGLSSFMPGFVGSLPLVGCKVVSTFPGNRDKDLPVVPATMVLLDPETGMVNAIMDGTELTRMRTGAVSGVATELLAREDARIGALFGTGGQAFSQLEAMLTVRPIAEVRVYDVDPGRVAHFIRTAAPLTERFGASLIAAASPDAAIDGADIITTVTTSAKPVFDGGRVQPGTHINGIGSYEPHKRELDETIILRANRLFVDNMDAVLSEAGDVLIPISEGKLNRSDIHGDLGDLLLGRVPGRTSRDQITVLKAVGFATLDIVIAGNIYRKAVAAGVGITI